MRGNTIKLNVQGLNIRRSTKHFKVNGKCFQSSGGVIERLYNELYREVSKHDIQNLDRK